MRYTLFMPLLILLVSVITISAIIQQRIDNGNNSVELSQAYEDGEVEGVQDSTFEGLSVQLIEEKAYPIGLDDIRKAIRSFAPYDNREPIRDELIMYKLRYGQQINGHNEMMFAQVLVPDNPQGVFVFGSGTTGVAPHCAPSFEDVARVNIGNYTNYLISQASQNWIMIMPDYAGYHSDTYHPYFVAEKEAEAMWSGLLAADEVIDADLRQLPLVMGGYSQGGHAALAAAIHQYQLQNRYILSGVVGFAAALDLQDLLIESPNLSPYLLYTWQKYYPDLGIRPEESLLAHWVGSLETDIGSNCVDKVRRWGTASSGIYQEPFLEALRSDSLLDSYPKISKIIDENKVIKDVEGLPVVLFQGKQDPIVHATTQRKYFRSLCDAGAKVSYYEYQTVDHYKIRQASFAETQQWLRSLLEGSLQDACDLKN